MTTPSTSPNFTVYLDQFTKVFITAEHSGKVDGNLVFYKDGIKVAEFKSYLCWILGVVA